MRGLGFQSEREELYCLLQSRTAVPELWTAKHRGAAAQSNWGDDVEMKCDTAPHEVLAGGVSGHQHG
jgi:hypothetical protein